MRLSTLLAERLKDEAAALGVPVAALLAHVIEAWLAEQTRAV